MTASENTVPLLSMPFANNDPMRDYSFYKTGITPEMTIPGVYGGTPFNRHMMNGIGYLATLGTFLWQTGYPFSEADIEKSSAFGGYPKGAIVYTMTNSGYVVEYLSLVDDNTNPLPEIVNGIPSENEYWKPLYETQYHATVPDYSAPIKTQETTFGAETIADNYNRVEAIMEVSEPSMVLVQCTIPAWDKLPAVNMIVGIPHITVGVRNEPQTSEAVINLGTLSIMSGGIASQYFPIGGGDVVVRCMNYNVPVYGDLKVSISAYRMGA